MGTFPQTLFVSDSGQTLEYLKKVCLISREVRGLPNKVQKLVTFGNVLKEGAGQQGRDRQTRGSGLYSRAVGH